MVLESGSAPPMLDSSADGPVPVEPVGLVALTGASVLGDPGPRELDGLLGPAMSLTTLLRPAVPEEAIDRRSAGERVARCGVACACRL
jgi:hypothetical protein